MTQERFFQIVDDPELLRRITYEELKTLALAYPYAHNLRCLLAIKARQIDHPEATRDLATAAAYSLDRTQLFLLVAPQVIAPQQVLTPQEVLELKPIETIKRELEALAPIAREEKPAEAPIVVGSPAPSEQPVLSIPEVPATLEETEEISTQTDEPQPVYQAFAAWIDLFQPPLLEKMPVPAALPIPEPEETETKEPEAPKSVGIAQQLAERSVTENQDVVSETLAKLYAKQGYRDKAAQMYARLALLFPEKSAYFAAEIDKLKK